MKIDERKCGCYVEIVLLEGTILRRAEIMYCPEHKAALEMYRALKTIEVNVNNPDAIEMALGKAALAFANAKKNPAQED